MVSAVEIRTVDKKAVRTLNGSCLCGAIAYQVPDDFEAAFYCHCSRCRRATGSAFKPMASIRFDRIVLTQGH